MPFRSSTYLAVIVILLGLASAPPTDAGASGSDAGRHRPDWWPYDPDEYPELTTYQKRSLHSIALMNRIAPVRQRVDGNTSQIQVGSPELASGPLRPIWRTRVMTDRWLEKGGYLFSGENDIHRLLGMTPGPGEKTSLLSDRVATVRILGGWARDEDGPHQDVVERAADGSLEYHWDRLYARLDPIVENDIEPFVVLDNVPFAFVSDDGELKSYGQHRAPEDFEEYGQFIADLCHALVARYGFEAANRWHYRFGTEMDNENHWEGGAEDSLGKYLKMYDHGTAGLRSVLPDAPVGPCNFNSPFAGRLERLVPPEKVFRHLTTGRNHATGEIGAPVDFIGISVYGVYWMGRPFEHPEVPGAGYDPSTLRLAAHMMKSWRNIHPRLKNLPIMVMEHGMLGNKAAERGREPGAFGGAWTAMQYMIALEEGISEIFHWQDFDVISGPTSEGEFRRDYIPTSSLWVKSNLERLVGSRWVPVTIGNATHSDYLHALAFLDEDKTTLLLSGYNRERSLNGTARFRVRIPRESLPASAGDYRLKSSTLTRQNSPHERMAADLKREELAETDDGRVWIAKNRDTYLRMYESLFSFQQYPGSLEEQEDDYALTLELPVPFTFILEIHPEGRARE